MSSINIKKSKVGSLHKALGVSKYKKIPSSKLSIKSNDSPTMRKKKQFAINSKKWKHEKGGLVEYGLGGWLKDTVLPMAGDAGAFTLDSTLSTFGAGNVVNKDWYSSNKRAGQAEDVIGVTNKIKNTLLNVAVPGAGTVTNTLQGFNTDNNSAQNREEANSANLFENTNSLGNGSTTYNPYNPTFATGGEVTNKPVSNSTTTVRNYQWTPQTRMGVYPYLAQAGLLGHGADSVTMKQWNMLPPEQTLQYVQDKEGFDYTKGNTANPGGIKYWTRDIIGDAPKNAGFSDHYWQSKAATVYANGGIIPQGTPNINAEDGEITQGTDGSMASINGNSHAQGGEDIAAQPGTRIFSDKLKASTGKTFAEEADIIRRQMAKYEKMLS
jgi:hypothetical protein